MQIPSSETLSGLTFSPREREVLKQYAQIIKSSLERAKRDILNLGAVSTENPTEKVDFLLGSLEDWVNGLSEAPQQNKMPKALAFCFVEELQKNIDPAIALPDTFFTHVARQDSVTLKSDATFYELLVLFYKVGSGFVRVEGAQAFTALYR